MPEGDTVYLAAKRLDALLAGRHIDRSDVRLPSLATIDFAGIDCLGVRPVGKHLLFRFWSCESPPEPALAALDITSPIAAGT